MGDKGPLRFSICSLPAPDPRIHLIFFMMLNLYRQTNYGSFIGRFERYRLIWRDLFAENDLPLHNSAATESISVRCSSKFAV